ncbi:cupredoxin domain-containing protein [Amycolatopsis sp. CA-230715]|uniref:cupredoxin domain-containing protein n=1 Tax=Amycolatopsis sp. CA-230715 TaxID=2745196 RepID=UPI001C025F97|nr:cupredoxin family copper-binding protein [Amycolatopsis sp. CA-230715]QWF78861.1 Plastocyanin [Amycolatopsis sp. CA-230715]
MRRTAVLLAGLFLVVLAPLGATPAKAATFQVMMQGYAFSPAALTVHVGDTVTWMQHDEAPHDATTTSAPASFRSPSLSSGQSWSYTFRTPGTYSYYCSVHPDMRATVTVLPAPAAPPAPAPAPVKPAPVAPAAPRKSAVAPPPAATPGASPPPAQPVPAGPTPSAVAAPPPVQALPQQAAAPVASAPTSPSLDPMLLVAGVVTAVAILCLLLLSSRPGEKTGGA